MSETNGIDVTKIMEEIRANIKESGADRIPLSFQDTSSGASASTLDEAVRYLAYNYEVTAYRMLEGNKLKRFFKKCIRKAGSFFVLPIVAQQNKLNYQYYMVCEAVKNQKSEIEDLQKTLTSLEAKVDALEKKA
ncbi:MAG: hypothetical protein IKP14_12405 [Clostridiales bacterium]|nr:hypothetical protein [Clostridiales bacterium]